MNIPDKAIVAAAKADYETNPGMLEWEEMHPKDQEIFIHSAEASLKAAAPFIAAQAWGEGREALALDCTRPVGPDGMRPSTPNPYGDPK